MKQSLLIVLSVFLLTATANTAQAFDEKDLAKLKETKKCLRCDLRKANLSKADLSWAKLKGAKLMGATWTDGTKKCKKGSIGKCK